MTNQYRITLLINRLFNLYVFTLIFLALISSGVVAQERLSKAEQKAIIDSLCSKLEKLYPDPEIVEKTSSGILRKFEEDRYSDFSLLSEFVQHLNDDLESLSKDGHLGILYDPVTAAELQKEKDSAKEGASYADLISESERWNNYGFKELKILSGNIGYLNLQMFFSLKYAAETAVAAMNFFSNCNALIIDLRRNGGGWDDMVNFLAGYFINNNDEIVFSISHSTLDNSYYASVPAAYVPGKKLTEIPVILLTSKSTASAAEAFTNIMKHFCKNVTVVGETTAGAENPVEDVALYDRYILRIPTWQKIYSYDGTGWEGTGIKPDIETESGNALSNAHMNLLLKLKNNADDETVKNKYQWYIESINALSNPVSVEINIMRSYSGKYGNRNIYYENDSLYYQYKGRTKRKMFAVSNDYFLIEGNDYFRIKFIVSNKKVTGLKEIHDDGTVTELIKE